MNDPATNHAPAPQTVRSASAAQHVLTAGACGLLAATVGPSFGAWHWLLDLASHFRWYYLLAAAGGLTVSLVLRYRWPTLCLVAAVAGNAWALLPFWLPLPVTGAQDRPGVEAAASPPLKAVTANVLRENPGKDRLLAYLRERRAEIVAVLEVDAAWAAALESLADIYPHRLIAPRPDNFGLAVLSRWPLAEQRVVEFVAGSYPSMVTRIRRPEGEFLFVAIHPFPPYTRFHWNLMREQFRSLAAFVAGAPLPCIVAGDYNATPWSVPFREFATSSGLRDTSLGHGVQGSWNARLWLPRIPIDHILVPPETRVLRRSLGPDIGSDHFPVEADLVLPVSR